MTIPTDKSISEVEYEGTSIPLYHKLQNKSATPSTSSQTISADSGYDGLSSVTVNAMATGSATTPATTITTNPTITKSGGNIVASYSGSQSITPTVSAGYVSSGTAGTVSTSGSNTVAATSLDSNLIAANIAQGVTIFGVEGTHSGGLNGYAITSTENSDGTQNLAITDNVSGSTTITTNGTYDVTNYASAVINVSGVDYAEKWLINSTLASYWDISSISYLGGFVSNGRCYCEIYGCDNLFGSGEMEIGDQTVPSGEADIFYVREYDLDDQSQRQIAKCIKAGTVTLNQSTMEFTFVWNNNAYRTIELSEESSGDFLTWLETNGTQQ